MQSIRLFTITCLTLLLLLPQVASAKLIIRGGASAGLGGGTTFNYLGPTGLGSLVKEADLGLITRINTPGANKFTIQAVPFENRRHPDVPEDIRCSPDDCEYAFSPKDDFSLQGFSDFYGLPLGVTSTYRWTIFEPSTATDPNFPNFRTLGDPIMQFDATGSETVSGSHVKVFLDTSLPQSLLPGVYEVALTTIYTAPSGQIFGRLDTQAPVGGSAGTQYPWNELGQTIEIESERYQLSFVSAPGALVMLISGLLLLCARQLTRFTPGRTRRAIF